MPYPKYPLLKKSKKRGPSLKKLIPDTDITYTEDKNFKPYSEGLGMKSFLKTFPDKLSGSSFFFKKTVEKVKFSRKIGKPIIFDFNSEVLKYGLSPLIIDLMERGWISALSIDLSFAIMDFEISLSGNFIDYDSASFKGDEINGIAEETGLFFNIALREFSEGNIGLGEVIGSYIESSRFEFSEKSILFSAYKLNIPVTVRSAFGTNPLFLFSGFDGKIFGKLVEKDFLLFSSVLSKLEGGGVFISFNPDMTNLKIISNAVLLNRINSDSFQKYYFSIVYNSVTEDDLNAIELLSKRKDLDVYGFRGETGIIFPLIAALIKQ